MNIIFKFLFTFFSLLILVYLILPNNDFLQPPPGALQSSEPADIETPLRRAYFTNMSREEVIMHYGNEFRKARYLNITLPYLRLNYPPEEAQSLIRDQTRSTFLEELAQPLRESFYINGFEPKEDKDTIVVNGRVWRQKITVRHQTSNPYIRLFIGILTLVSAAVVIKTAIILYYDVRKRT